MLYEVAALPFQAHANYGTCSIDFDLQLAKIILVHPRYEIVIGTIKLLSICYWIFFIAPSKVIDLTLLCLILSVSSLLLFFITISIIIALLTINY